VAGESRAATYGPGDVDDLLTLAASRPQDGLAKARAVLASRPGSLDASIAHHAAGFVLREFGDLTAAMHELRAALRYARRAASRDREADVLAALGVALVYAGRTTAGLTAFDRAARQAHGVQAARIRLRRGIALWTLGRYPEALDDLRHAVAMLKRSDDPIWAGRALTARALVYLALGSTRRASNDFGAAERMFARTSQELESTYTVHNRAMVAFRSGDLPAALSNLDEAARRYRLLNVPPPDLSIDRCSVLLAAGLPREALAEADTAINDFERIHGQPTKKAELLLTAANSALAAAEPQIALARARAAQRLFGAQHREWWRAHARFVVLRAHYASGMVSSQLLRDVKRIAAQLSRLGSSEAAQAHLLAGRVALELGRRQDADLHLKAAGRNRRRGPAMSRASGWLAEALRAEAAADPRMVLRACRRGLDVLDEHRLTLGASELRARATAHGAELAELAQRRALESGRPRLLLTWSERWRATALAVPPVRPVEDPELGADLAAAREVTSRLEEARADGTPVAALKREQLRLENAIRARVIRAKGTRGPPHERRFDAADLLGQLGGIQLIQIVNVAGSLHVLVCRAGRLRQFAAGRADDAARAVELARFGLRRLAYNRPTDSAESAFAILTASGHKLEETLLGPATRYLGDGHVVIVPPGRFHAIPWALLPSLRDRPISVAPSARAFVRANSVAPPARRRVVFVRGPGLRTGGAEVPALAHIYDDVTMLGGGQATTSRVLDAIDGAWLAHIAAHGSFRADSPLFSSLHMDDGPLTVYDFERLRRAPYRLILPSCDSGMLAPTGADELLGLVSSVLPLGAAGVVASVVPLNDIATVPLMLELHRWMAAGHTLAESLCRIRRDLKNDPVLLATAWSLVALGAG
jgi:tetratricopeptide (TPR) repeat protein